MYILHKYCIEETYKSKHDLGRFIILHRRKRERDTRISRHQFLVHGNKDTILTEAISGLR